MIPIVQPPRVVGDHVDYFQGIFSKPQSRHLGEYISGLITSENKTVEGINCRILGHRHQNSLNSFLTQSPWSPKRLNETRLSLLQEHEETRWRRDGSISLDDDIIHKTGVHIPGAARQYDPAQNRYVWAQRVVTSHYTDPRTTYPLQYLQYLKEDGNEAEERGFKTKIQLACELVEDAVESGVPARIFFMDSYLRKR